MGFENWPTCELCLGPVLSYGFIDDPGTPWVWAECKHEGDDVEYAVLEVPLADWHGSDEATRVAAIGAMCFFGANVAKRRAANVDKVNEHIDALRDIHTRFNEGAMTSVDADLNHVRLVLTDLIVNPGRQR